MFKLSSQQDTIDIEYMLLKSKASKKLKKQLSLLIASYRLLLSESTCKSCDKPCMNSWCITKGNK